MHTANLFVLLFGILFSSELLGQSSIHRNQAYITDGSVDTIHYSNGYAMLLGDFQNIGPYTGGGAVINTMGNVDLNMPKINGKVNVVISDGNGGWYVGGDFESINDVAIKYLAHILPNKTFDQNWRPDPDGNVATLRLSGTTLYVGGNFTTVAGVNRNYVAAFNTTTGTITNWNPDCNNRVYAIEISGSNILIGGEFTAVGGVARTLLASVNNTTGAVNSWNVPVTGSGVYTLLMNGDALFVGGHFTAVDGVTRNALAAVSIASQNLYDWNPNPTLTLSTPRVDNLLLNGTTLYVGGYFSTISGVSQAHLASYTVSDPSAITRITAFDPVVNGSVSNMVLSGGTLYFIGYFNLVNGVYRYTCAAVETSTGNVTSWAPNPNGYEMEGLAIQGASIFIGGNFNGMNWTSRDSRALIEESTNTIWPFTFTLNPQAQVHTMAVVDNTLYLGGRFTDVNGEPRRHLAAIDLATGKLLPWTATISMSKAAADLSAVMTMGVRDNLLYVGGIFTSVTVGGVASARDGLAALDLETAAVSSWNPSVPSGIIYSLDIVEDIVYVGGNFDLLGGASRTNLGTVDATTGVVLPWAPNASGDVTKIKVSNNTAYVLGDFPNGIGGQVRNYGIAALSTATGLATSWNPQFSSLNVVNDFALNRRDVYVGGFFETVDGIKRNGLASFNLLTGMLNDWNPDVGQSDRSSSVYALAASEAILFVGGRFSHAGTENRTNYAEYNICMPFETTISADGNTTFCAGESLNLISDQVYPAYLWSTGETTRGINVTEPGSYNVEAIDTEGCRSTVDPIVVSVKPGPVAKISVNNEVLEASPGDSYQWLFSTSMNADFAPIPGAIDSNFEIMLLQYGMYVVAVTDNGCTTRSEPYVYLITKEESEAPSMVKAYPNPVKEELWIEVPEPALLSIQSTKGEMLSSVLLDAHHPNKIQFQYLENGIYILVIQSPHKKNYIKISKLN